MRASALRRSIGCSALRLQARSPAGTRRAPRAPRGSPCGNPGAAEAADAAAGASSATSPSWAKPGGCPWRGRTTTSSDSAVKASERRGSSRSPRSTALVRRPNASDAAARTRVLGVQHPHVEHAAVETPSLERRRGARIVRSDADEEAPHAGATPVDHHGDGLGPAQHPRRRDERGDPLAPSVLELLAHRDEVGVHADRRGVEHGDRRRRRRRRSSATSARTPSPRCSASIARSTDAAPAVRAKWLNVPPGTTSSGSPA